MRFLTTICVLLATAVVFCKAEVKIEDGVLVLTKDSFESVIEDNEFVVVDFYAPWCGYSMALAPEYAKAAQTLAAQGSAIKLAKVDIEAETSLRDEFHIRDYPTVKFFKNNRTAQYQGNATEEEIVAWCIKKTGPSAKELFTESDFNAFIDDNEDVVIGFYSDRKTIELFQGATFNYDELPVGVTGNEDIFSAHGAVNGSVINFKKVNGEIVTKIFH